MNIPFCMPTMVCCASSCAIWIDPQLPRSLFISIWKKETGEIARLRMTKRENEWMKNETDNWNSLSFSLSLSPYRCDVGSMDFYSSFHQSTTEAGYFYHAHARASCALSFISFTLAFHFSINISLAHSIRIHGMCMRLPVLPRSLSLAHIIEFSTKCKILSNPVCVRILNDTSFFCFFQFNENCCTNSKNFCWFIYIHWCCVWCAVFSTVLCYYAVCALSLSHTLFFSCFNSNEMVMWSCIFIVLCSSALIYHLFIFICVHTHRARGINVCVLVRRFVKRSSLGLFIRSFVLNCYFFSLLLLLNSTSNCVHCVHVCVHISNARGQLHRESFWMKSFMLFPEFHEKKRHRTDRTQC